MSPQQAALDPLPTRQASSSFTPEPEGPKSEVKQVLTLDDKGRIQDSGSFIADPVENAPTTTDPPPEDSFFQKAWHFANTPLLSKENVEGAMGLQPGQLERGHEHVERLENQGRPLAAAIAQFGTGATESSRDILQGLSTPASLALAALSFGESLFGRALWTAGTAGKAAVIGTKAVQTAAGLTYGTQGAVTALEPRKEGESDADYAERVLSGSAQAVFALSGESAANKDILRGLIRNRLHLSDHVADIVVGRLSKIAEARERQVKQTENVTSEAAQKRRDISSAQAEATVRIQSQLEDDIRALESQTTARMTNIREAANLEIASLKDQIGELDQQKVRQGTQIIVDTAQTLHNEKIRVQKPFEEIGDTFEEPVAKAEDIKNLLLNTLQEHGAQPTELPPAATKALGKGTTGETYLDEEGGLKSLGGAEGGEVSFNDLTRIKDDVYGAAYSHKDPVVRNALYDAGEKISDLQEAEVLKTDKAKGIKPESPSSLTTKYKRAKAEYLRFKRGIGSELVDGWLSAYDMQDQEMSGKIAKLVVKQSGEGATATLALRNILRSVGVDTTPFDQTVNAMRKTRSRTRAIPRESRAAGRTAKSSAAETRESERQRSAIGLREARATARAQRGEVSQEEKARIAEIDKDTKAEVIAAEAKGDIIPGRTTSELAGMSNEQLLRERLNSMANSAKSNGIGNPYRLSIIIYGLFKLVSGTHPLGAAGMVAYGAGGEGLAAIVKTKRFQDWVVRESGIEPGNKRAIMGLKNGLTGNLYPLLRRAAKGQAPAAAVSRERDSQQ